MKVRLKKHYLIWGQWLEKCPDGKGKQFYIWLLI